MEVGSTVVNSAVAPLRVAWVYDFDAVRGATGVTRHAMAQLQGLARRGDVRLQAVSGRIHGSDALLSWEDLESVARKELPLGTPNAFRVWRTFEAPPLEWWTGPIDWAYSPAEHYVATKGAKRAVTTHDVQQDLLYGGPRRRAILDRNFAKADLVLSVSTFNTQKLLEAFPRCRNKLAQVPNAADDLFHEPTPDADRAKVRAELNLPSGMPYLLSVANFQPRKNLPRLVRAAGRIDAVRNGELALVLIGEGEESHAGLIREEAAALGRRAIIRLPGYVQGKRLRAIYAESSLLVFPSTCESFGIPTLEAMAQGIPVALADSTALPEIAGEAGWYFPPEDEEAIADAIRAVLSNDAGRARKVELGRVRSAEFRWSDSVARLVAALQAFR